jgi:hypothetical protein
MLARLRELLRQLPGWADERRFLLMGGSNDIFFSGTSAKAKNTRLRTERNVRCLMT